MLETFRFIGEGDAFIIVPAFRFNAHSVGHFFSPLYKKEDKRRTENARGIVEPGIEQVIPGQINGSRRTQTTTGILLQCDALNAAAFFARWVIKADIEMAIVQPLCTKVLSAPGKS